MGTFFSTQWSSTKWQIYLLGKMLVLIDKVAHFSLTQRGCFTRWINYAVLSNKKHLSYLPGFPQWTVKTNDWNRFASFDYRSYPILYKIWKRDLQVTVGDPLTGKLDDISCDNIFDLKVKLMVWIIIFILLSEARRNWDVT